MRNPKLPPLILICAALLLCSCSPSNPTPHPEQASTRQEGGPMTATSFTLSSAAFPDSGRIPKKYTCDDANQSPQLAWAGAPANTQSLALILDDPDAPAGTWTHWLLWNIPARPTTLPPSIPKLRVLVSGAHQGYNDFHRIGYGGPCPPPGPPHRYFFRLYSLDAPLDLPPGATRADLETAIHPHLLAQTQTLGIYQRQ